MPHFPFRSSPGHHRERQRGITPDNGISQTPCFSRVLDNSVSVGITAGNAVSCPPKAEVVSSNLAGCASFLIILAGDCANRLFARSPPEFGNTGARRPGWLCPYNPNIRQPPLLCCLRPRGGLAFSDWVQECFNSLPRDASYLSIQAGGLCRAAAPSRSARATSWSQGNCRRIRRRDLCPCRTA